MLEPLFRILHITGEGCVAVFFAQHVHLLAVLETQIVEVTIIGQAVLSNDHMFFTFRGFIQQFRHPPAGIGASDIDHSRLQRIEDVAAVIEQLLRG